MLIIWSHLITSHSAVCKQLATARESGNQAFVLVYCNVSRGMKNTTKEEAVLCCFIKHVLWYYWRQISYQIVHITDDCRRVNLAGHEKRYSRSISGATVVHLNDTLFIIVTWVDFKTDVIKLLQYVNKVLVFEPRKQCKESIEKTWWKCLDVNGSAWFITASQSYLCRSWWLQQALPTDCSTVQLVSYLCYTWISL